MSLPHKRLVGGMNVTTLMPSENGLDRFLNGAEPACTMVVMVYDPECYPDIEPNDCFEMRWHSGDCKKGGYPICPPDPAEMCALILAQLQDDPEKAAEWADLIDTNTQYEFTQEDDGSVTVQAQDKDGADVGAPFVIPADTWYEPTPATLAGPNANNELILQQMNADGPTGAPNITIACVQPQIRNECGELVPKDTNLLRPQGQNPGQFRALRGPTIVLPGGALPPPPQVNTVLIDEQNFAALMNPYQCAQMLMVVQMDSRERITLQANDADTEWTFPVEIISDLFINGVRVERHTYQAIDDGRSPGTPAGQITFARSETFNPPPLIPVGGTAMFSRTLTYTNQNNDVTEIPDNLVINLPGAQVFFHPLY